MFGVYWLIRERINDWKTRRDIRLGSPPVAPQDPTLMSKTY